MLDRLFAPAENAEIQAVRNDWASRDPVADKVDLVSSSPILVGNAGLGEVRIYSHQVEGNPHFGAVVVPPEERTNLPVLIYNHGGDSGVSLSEISLILAALGDWAGRVVLAAPSFRSERLATGNSTYESTGDPSPWDRDVDDALSLLEVVLSEVPAADPERIVALGISRGGGVSLLMGIRDSRIDGVIEIAGPTDFFGPYVRDVVEEAFDGTPRDLPGLDFLTTNFVLPLKNENVSVDAVRLELVRRSSVLFAESLPPVQVHLGTADDVVAVSQANALRDALDRVPGRSGDEVHLYPGADHNPITMSGLTTRIASFLDRILAS